jgi:photosystem II stability/assembly factor-like uncharacterized protein
MSGFGGMFAETQDYGGSWFLTHYTAGTPVLSQTDIFSVHYFDDNNFIACGSNGTITRSSDAGRTWTNVPTGLPSTIILQHITFLNSLTGYASGTIWSCYQNH